MEQNFGISITGGNVTAGAMAAGAHAKARNVAAPPSDDLASMRAELAQLIELLSTQPPDMLPDADRLVETAERAKEELARERPNRHTVLGLLDGLARSVSSVATLATAVQSLQHVAAAIL